MIQWYLKTLHIKEKMLAKKIRNKGTQINYIDASNGSFDGQEPPDSFVDLKSELIVGSFLSVKTHFNLTHSQEKSRDLNEVLNEAYFFNISREIIFAIRKKWIPYFKNKATSGSYYFKIQNLLPR